MRTRVRLCGPLALEIDGRDAVAAVPAGQARSLLAYLLTRADRRAERGALIDVVWPSGAPKDPQADLRVILTRLRRALAPATLEGRQQLRLALPGAGLGRRGGGHPRDRGGPREPPGTRRGAARSSRPRRRSSCCGRASCPARRAPGPRRSAARTKSSSWRRSSGSPAAGWPSAARSSRPLSARPGIWCRARAFRETGHRLLMEALAATGNVAEALQVYDELRCLLRDELGVAPAAEVQALHQRLLAGEPAIREPVRTVVRAGIAAAPTRYARNGEISLAYQVLGDGPTTLLLVTGWVLPMEAIWEDPAYARFVERLASSFRVILWDKRGTGLSDRVARRPAADARAAHGRHRRRARRRRRRARRRSPGLSEGAVLAALFGAAHPERTRRAGALRRLGRAPSATTSYRGMPSRAELRRVRRERPALVGRHGPVPRAVGADPRSTTRPCATGGRARCTAARARRPRSPGCGCSPTSTSARSCGAIHAPTLVLHRAGDRIIAVENGRWLAAHMPGADYVELRATTTSGGSATRTPCSTRSSASSAAPRRAREPDRVPGDRALHRHRRLDPARVASSATAAGATSWHATRRSSATGSRASAGMEVKTLGDGVPRGLRRRPRARSAAPPPSVTPCPAGPRAARRAAHRRGRRRRRTTSTASPSPSPRASRRRRPPAARCSCRRTVRDLVAGSGIAFEDRGTHDLKGVADDWQLYALASA